MYDLLNTISAPIVQSALLFLNMWFVTDPCYLNDKDQKQQAIVVYVQFPVYHHRWIAVSEGFVSVVKLLPSFNSGRVNEYFCVDSL